MGGFETATMRFGDGRRIDAAAHSRHDTLAEADYRLASSAGIRTFRDAFRWNVIERTPLRYDWSSAQRALAAAQAAGVQVIWDLCHFGYPSWLDPWSADFVARFAAYAHEAAHIVAAASDAVPYWVPVNEISYWAFAGGEEAHFSPMGRHRGDAWKRQMCRAAIAATRAVRAVDPRARIIHTDPVIHIAARHAENAARAEHCRLAMFDAWDMIAGRAAPELGGGSDCLDIVGVNFYGTNQWHIEGDRIAHGQVEWRPFSAILAEVWQRYGRPIIVTETGAEEPSGPSWLHAVMHETRTALRAGVPVHGLCIYPLMDYPGWTDDRHCPCGLIAVSPDWRTRSVRPAFADALQVEAAISAFWASREAGGAEPVAAAALLRRDAVP